MDHDECFLLFSVFFLSGGKWLHGLRVREGLKALACTKRAPEATTSKEVTEVVHTSALSKLLNTHGASAVLSSH